MRTLIDALNSEAIVKCPYGATTANSTEGCLCSFNEYYASCISSHLVYDCPYKVYNKYRPFTTYCVFCNNLNIDESDYSVIGGL